jgi:hypothetical protein
MKVTYDTTVCPFCGGPARWPTTGEVTKDEETWARYQDDENYCLLGECCDEGGGTVGYVVMCKRGNQDE